MGNKITLQATPIEGVYIGEIKSFNDQRGRFYRLFDKDDFEKLISKPIVEINFSENKIKGTVRGMHYEKTLEKNYKLIKCIKGSMYDQIIDLRKDSKTFLKKIAITLFEKDDKILLIPSKVAHGFQTLEGNTSILYMHTMTYDKNIEHGINIMDPKFNLKWELPPKNLSSRDKKFEFVKTVYKGI